MYKENVKKKIGNLVNPDVMDKMKPPLEIKSVLGKIVYLPGVRVECKNDLVSFSRSEHIKIKSEDFENFVNELNDIINHFREI